MHTITIYRDARGWIADFSDADPEIRRDMLAALGTDQIPTPYTPAAPAARVIATITARNPGHTVIEA